VSFPCDGGRALSHDAFPLRLKRSDDIVPLFTSVYVRLPQLGFEAQSCRIGQETSAKVAILGYRLVPGYVGRGATSRLRPRHTFYDLQTWEAVQPFRLIFWTRTVDSNEKETLFRRGEPQQRST
jgi:hypothetical protein